jgi:hypothetical protein
MFIFIPCSSSLIRFGLNRALTRRRLTNMSGTSPNISEGIIGRSGHTSLADDKPIYKRQAFLQAASRPAPLLTTGHQPNA